MPVTVTSPRPRRRRYLQSHFIHSANPQSPGGLPSELSTTTCVAETKPAVVPGELSTELPSVEPVASPVDRKTEREGGPPEWLRQEDEQREQTARTRAALLADLLALHVRPTQAEVLLDSVEWVRLAYAIVYVQQELHTGLVRSPAGLLVWWLKRFG